MLAKGATLNALTNFKKAFAMDATMTATKVKVVAIVKEVVPSGQ